MIYFIRNESSKDVEEYFIRVDDETLNNARAHIYSREPNFTLSSKDFNTSRKIARHSLAEFPKDPGQIYLHFYPDDIEHLDKPTGTFITHNYNEGESGFLIHVTIGTSSLNEWNSPYSFKDYVYELYRILDSSNDINHLNLIDTDSKILNRHFDAEGKHKPTKLELSKIRFETVYGLEIVFPYNSPTITIEDEVNRISKVLRAAHLRTIWNLTPSPHTNSIEIRKLTLSEPKEYQLFINNTLFNEAEVSGTAEHYEDGPYYFISLDTPKSLYKLGSFRFAELPEKTLSLSIELEPEPSFKWEHIEMEPHVKVRTPFGHEYLGWEENNPFKEYFTIRFTCKLDVENWKGERSPTDYLNAIEAGLTYKPENYVYLSEPGQYQFHVLFKILPTSWIVDEVIRFKNILWDIFNTVDNLGSPTTHSITKPFNFPDEVAVACEQYLLYFTQFLKDLGVKATSDIQHEAGQVLFTVTPTNEEEALDKIRAALDVYLHLPASPVGNDMGNEIALQRLESQVLRFQSDLRLAAAELQAKNATIEAMTLTINVQKSLLNGEILLDSMKDVTPKEDEKVEFLKGAVALSVYKDKGVELNWARMWKQLKDLFLEKDEK